MLWMHQTPSGLVIAAVTVAILIGISDVELLSLERINSSKTLLQRTDDSYTNSARLGKKNKLW